MGPALCACQALRLFAGTGKHPIAGPAGSPALDGVVALDQLRLVPEIYADEGDLLLIVKCTGWCALGIRRAGPTDPGSATGTMVERESRSVTQTFNCRRCGFIRGLDDVREAPLVIRPVEAAAGRAGPLHPISGLAGCELQDRRHAVRRRRQHRPLRTDATFPPTPPLSRPTNQPKMECNNEARRP